jgi:hypothetical protein
VIRVAASVAFYQFGLVDVIKDEDGSAWVQGVLLKQSWEQYRVGVLDLPFVLAEAFNADASNRGYVYLLGALYYLWDLGVPGRLVAGVFNCFLGALTVILAYRAARVLFGSAVAARVGWWTALFPSLILWSAQTIKEPVVIFLESVVLYSCIQHRRAGFSSVYACGCVAAIVLLKPFRFYAMVIAAGVALVTFLLPSRATARVPMQAMLAVMAAFVVVMVLAGPAGLREDEAATVSLQYAATYREGAARFAQSGVETSYDITSPTGLGMATVVGAAHLLLAPFPWQWAGGSVRLLLTIPEVLVWWWLFFTGVIPGLRLALRTRFSDIQPVLVYLCGFGLLYSVLFGNIGLAYRQRAQLLPWLLIFAAAWYEHRESQRVHAHAIPVPAI